MTKTENQIKDVQRSAGYDLVGVANAEEFREGPEGRRPFHVLLLEVEYC